MSLIGIPLIRNNRDPLSKAQKFWDGKLKQTPFGEYFGHRTSKSKIIIGISGTMMVNNPLIRLAIFSGGWHWGGALRFPLVQRLTIFQHSIKAKEPAMFCPLKNHGGFLRETLKLLKLPCGIFFVRLIFSGFFLLLVLGKVTYLVGAQPPPSCSFARHLGSGKWSSRTLICSSRSAQLSYFFCSKHVDAWRIIPVISHLGHLEGE